MTTHSSVLAWRIPGTGEPGGLPSMGSQSWTRLKRLSSSSREQFELARQEIRKTKKRGKIFVLRRELVKLIKCDLLLVHFMDVPI